MPRSTAPPSRTPTLDDLAQQAVGIDAECRDCGHKVLLGFELFLERYGSMSFPAFVHLLKCSACGSRNVSGRPQWPTR
jgi:DNA-directed RNA polymerase subunit RPC12/RpoP